jgi:hypothetical protein
MRWKITSLDVLSLEDEPQGSKTLSKTGSVWDPRRQAALDLAEN